MTAPELQFPARNETLRYSKSGDASGVAFLMAPRNWTRNGARAIRHHSLAESGGGGVPI